MPSDHRLHPLSILFNLGKQAGGLVIPLLLFLAGSRSSGAGWELLGVIFLVPYTLVALGRYLTFRYRYDPGEMVIHSGVFFRNERHVPYARIQNIEAVQNLAHRLFGVVEVRVQTGGGDEPEATMSVLPIGALEEMRRRVFEGRGAASSEPAGIQDEDDGVLLRLPPSELMLSGFIENRGLLVVAAAFGLIWQIDVLPGLIGRYLGFSRTSARTFARAVFSRGVDLTWIPGALAAIVVFLLFTRVLSMGWALAQFHGFTVHRRNGDLRVSFGLFTRLTTTIPLRRIQQLTVRQTPLHRLFGRASVRVTTAGGTGEERTFKQRAWLAPVINRAALPGFLAEVLPGVEDQSAFEWRGVHPRAFRRAVKVSGFLALVATAASVSFFRWYSLALLPVFLSIAVLQAWLYVRHLGWAVTDHAIAFRRGAFWRYVTIARFSKIQAVSVRESPFDRRTGMARVGVDTAGTGETERVEIPYLDRDVAAALSRELAVRAARIAFKW